jgi:hypothetical protein
MMPRLAQLRDRERDSVLVGSYRAAIERLSALVYRIKTRPERQVIGLTFGTRAHTLLGSGLREREARATSALCQAATLPVSAPQCLHFVAAGFR